MPSADETPAAAGTGGRRGYLVKVVVSVALLVALVAVSDVDRLPAVLAATDPLLFALGTAVVLAGSVVVPAFGARIMLRSAMLELSLAELVRTNFVVRFYSLVLPRSTATAVRWLKYRRGGHGRDAFALMAFETLVHSLLAGVVATVVLWLELDGLSPRATALGVLAAVVVSTALLAFATAPFALPRAGEVLRRAVRIVSVRLPAGAGTRLDRAAAAVAEYHGMTPGHALQVAGLAVLSLVLAVGGQYVYVLALDVPVTLAALLWIRSVTYVLTLFPFTIAGAGVREIGYVAFLTLYGVDTADALALALLVLGSNLVAGLVGGGVEAWDQFVARRDTTG